MSYRYYKMEYNYYEAVLEDVREVLKETDVRDYEELYDRLWTNDAVTGNGSGSYTFSTYQAEENLCHNMDLLREALEEFGCDISYLEKGAEACDVAIRCYLLGQALSEALEELENGE